MTNETLRFPRALKQGSVIGIVSPSRAVVNARDFEMGRARLEAQGFRVVIHPQNNLAEGQWAGNDAARAQAIMDMFADPAIDAIMCARGGNGAIRLLDRLDYGLIARNPKPFIGFSDITVLLHALQRKSGLMTFHGPMLASSFGLDFAPRSLDDFIKVMTGLGTPTALTYPEACSVVPGEVEGVLIGGNLTMLQSIAGTAFGWTGEGAILFIEDVSEALYRIDRTLHHLRHLGVLDKVAAVLVGEAVDMETEDDRPYALTFEHVLKEAFPGVPLAMNLPCGHGSAITTFPLGVKARVSIKESGVVLTWSGA